MKATRLPAIVVLMAFSVRPAHAIIEDIGRLTMGRTTYPKSAWVVDYFQDDLVPRWSVPVGHTLSQRAVVAYGITDRLSLGTVAMTLHAEHKPQKVDRWGAAMLYRLISEPFELAPIVGVFPIVPNKRTEFLLGVDALKNLGHWTLHLGYANEFKQGEGETVYGGNHHVVEPGVFYRFGLHGIMGVQYTYQTLPPIVTLVQTPFGPMSVTTPATTIGMWGPVLGGSISKNMFLGLAQRFGVNRSSPDYMTTLQFQLYFGPYALGSWGL